jgi:hypothetical protein
MKGGGHVIKITHIRMVKDLKEYLWVVRGKTRVKWLEDEENDLQELKMKDRGKGLFIDNFFQALSYASSHLVS